MKKGISEKSFNFDKIYHKLRNKEFEQVTLRTYKDSSISDEPLIEALVYPSDYAYEKMGGSRGDDAIDIAVFIRMQDLVFSATRFCSKKNKISRVIPLESRI